MFKTFKITNFNNKKISFSRCYAENVYPLRFHLQLFSQHILNWSWNNLFSTIFYDRKMILFLYILQWQHWAAHQRESARCLLVVVKGAEDMEPYLPLWCQGVSVHVISWTSWRKMQVRGTHIISIFCISIWTCGKVKIF